MSEPEENTTTAQNVLSKDKKKSSQKAATGRERPEIELICRQCGQPFLTRTKQRRTCSRRCRNAVHYGHVLRERATKERVEDEEVVAALLARDNGDRSKLEALLKERTK
jgi:hypothetical protein